MIMIMLDSVSFILYIYIWGEKCQSLLSFSFVWAVNTMMSVPKFHVLTSFWHYFNGSNVIVLWTDTLISDTIRWKTLDLDGENGIWNWKLFSKLHIFFLKTNLSQTRVSGGQDPRVQCLAILSRNNYYQKKQRKVKSTRKFYLNKCINFGRR